MQRQLLMVEESCVRSATDTESGGHCQYNHRSEIHTIGEYTMQTSRSPTNKKAMKEVQQPSQQSVSNNSPEPEQIIAPTLDLDDVNRIDFSYLAFCG